MWSSSDDVLERIGVPEDEENLHWRDDENDEDEDEDKSASLEDDDEWDPEDGVEDEVEEEEELGWTVGREESDDDWG